MWPITSALSYPKSRSAAGLKEWHSQYADAGRLLDETEALIAPTQYMLCMPELLRLRARLFNAMENGEEAAAQQLGRAIDVARGQGARLPELRAATELAQFWLDQGESERARSLLAPIVTSFSEGFELADVQNAKATLGVLQ